MNEKQTWRKSSFSGANENCVEVSMAAWRKSSYSGGRENCVELADLPGAAVVRDSKSPGAAVLAFAPAEWSVFLAGLRES
ncbi:DUF397 domain-containing protein [Nocardiopsis sp. RSe5-2]|uniref:DUF397 domain-containing protein n=1 Tax=Nocardiopsis endophytica TaxID=3018445 RepID=A0ABT4U430_9ACTN|nr:DUF397 domain-containing protein [Nocardiopsis endophytica]MDA2811708.1 DUF397 domain-containing protein [Nocardiopsis endophytica]